MNSLPSAKYKQIPNEIEKNSLNSEASKEWFYFLRLKKIREEKVRQEKFNKKIYKRKKLNLRSPLEVGEEVLVLASQLKKKDSPGKFYKSSVDNKSYFHKSETLLITNRQKIEEKIFLLVKIFGIWKKNWSLGSREKKFMLFQTILINFYKDFSKNVRFCART